MIELNYGNSQNIRNPFEKLVMAITDITVIVWNVAVIASPSY